MVLFNDVTPSSFSWWKTSIKRGFLGSATSLCWGMAHAEWTKIHVSSFSLFPSFQNKELNLFKDNQWAFFQLSLCNHGFKHIWYDSINFLITFTPYCWSNCPIFGQWLPLQIGFLVFSIHPCHLWQLSSIVPTSYHTSPAQTWDQLFLPKVLVPFVIERFLETVMWHTRGALCSGFIFSFCSFSGQS